DARDIAGGGNHAALAASDDERLVLEGRVVALFDRGIEGVAVDMGEMQAIEFGMARQPGAATTFAARRNALLRRQAITAEAVFGIVVWKRHRRERKENVVCYAGMGSRASGSGGAV